MLTKQQRLDAYTYAYLLLVSEGQFTGVCRLLCEDYAKACFNQVWGVTKTDKLFPEFYRQRPQQKAPCGLWFDNTHDRIHALERAIALCEQAKD